MWKAWVRAPAVSGFSVGLVVLSLSAQERSRPATDQNRPIAVFVADIDGDGLSFTSPDRGVAFDIDGSGRRVRLGWTQVGSDDGFLFLDTNGNGAVDSGRELLGNGWRRTNGSRVDSADETLKLIQGVASVPLGPVSGELAQVAFVDQQDDVFGRLRVWRDRNQNGLSERSELENLAAVGIARIPTGFRMLEQNIDAAGNRWLLQGSVLGASPTVAQASGRRGLGPSRVLILVEFRRVE